MTVPGLSGFINSKFQGTCIKERGNGKIKVDHLFVDVNNLLYRKYKYSKTKPDRTLFDIVNLQIYSLFDKVDVEKSIFFAVDGPGPISKFSEQKDRRFKVIIIFFIFLFSS